MEGQDYKMQTIVYPRSQNIVAWMVKPLSVGCVKTVVACWILITSDYIWICKSSSSEKIDPHARTYKEINFVCDLTLFCSIAKNRQVNAVSYLHGVHKPCLLLWEKTMPAVCTACWPTHNFLCVHPDRRPHGIVFGLGMRLHVRIETKLENSV